MLRHGIVTALLSVAPVIALAQALPPYPTNSYPLPTTPAGGEGALGAMYNPAGLGFLKEDAVDFWWNDRSVTNGRLDNWGVAAGKKLGASAYRKDFFLPEGGTGHVTDYQIGYGYGNAGKCIGVAYGWSSGDKDLVGRENFLSFGTILHPSPQLSLGLDWRKAIGTSDRDLLGSAAIGSGKLRLFVDYALDHKQVWNEGALMGGVIIRPKPAFDAAFRWRESGEFQLSLGLFVSKGGARVANDYHEGDRQRTDYLLRINPMLHGAE